MRRWTWDDETWSDVTFVACVIVGFIAGVALWTWLA